MQKYIPVKEIKDYLKDKSYTSINKKRTIKEMKRKYRRNKEKKNNYAKIFISKRN